MEEALEKGNFLDKNGSLALLKTLGKTVIEIGCGPNKKIPHSITIDILDVDGVDIVADMNQGLAFLDSQSIDEIHSYHFLEHLEDLGAFMQEVYRVLKPNGRFIGTVPHFSNPYYYSDYTHRTPFGLYTFSYFAKQDYFARKVPNFYSNIDFNIKIIDLIFTSPFLQRSRLKRLLQCFFNFNRFMQELYEENFCYLFPAYELKFELEKKAYSGFKNSL